jgi:hypothetical protein
MPLISSLCWGLLIVTAEKGKAIEILYSDARLLVTFFTHNLTTGNVFFMFDYDTKEKKKTSKHSAIWLRSLAQIR